MGKSVTGITGLKIVVVGASGTLGRAFAIAARAAGAHVQVAGRRDPQLALHYSPLDIRSAASCDAFVDELLKEGHPIDVLINFAGIHHEVMPLGHATACDLATQFASVIEVNVQGAFNLTAAIARIFVQQGYGHLIHLCSDASRVSLDGSHGYVASKHALEGLIKSSAAQLARHGVRVNGIAPGTVETDLNRHLLRNEQGELSLRAATILAHTPTKRFATVEGIVESIMALCIPQRHLTGNVLFCDDGYVIEGHSWPEGNRAVYDGPESLSELLTPHPPHKE